MRRKLRSQNGNVTFPVEILSAYLHSTKLILPHPFVVCLSLPFSICIRPQSSPCLHKSLTDAPVGFRNYVGQRTIAVFLPDENTQSMAECMDGHAKVVMKGGKGDKDLISSDVGGRYSQDCEKKQQKKGIENYNEEDSGYD